MTRTYWIPENDGRVRQSHEAPLLLPDLPPIPDVATWEEVEHLAENSPDPATRIVMLSRLARRGSHHDITPGGMFRCVVVRTGEPLRLSSERHHRSRRIPRYSAGFGWTVELGDSGSPLP